MALPKYYNTGTVSVANGATAVTGVGTAWANTIKDGDVFRRAGASVRVASVTDNTHLTLAENWPGTTLSGSAYEIAITYDGPEFQLRTRELLEQLADFATWYQEASAAGQSKLFLYEDTDNGSSYIALQAAAALGANRAFTLPDVDVAMHAQSKTFLEAATAEAQRAAIGARIPDATAVDSATDFDTIVTAGWSTSLYQGNAHVPAGGSGYWYLLVLAYAGGNVTQVAFPYGVGGSPAMPSGVQMRARFGGTWSAWRRVLFADDVIDALNFEQPVSGTWPINIVSNNRGILFRQTDGSAALPMYFLNSSSANIGSINTTNSATTYTTSSDPRIKTNRRAVSDEEAVGLIMELVPEYFEMIGDPGVEVMGFVADNTKAVMPWATHGEVGAVEAVGDLFDVKLGAAGEEELELLMSGVPEVVAGPNQRWVETGTRPKLMQVDYGRATPLLAAGLRAALNRIAAIEAVLAGPE